MCLPSLPVEDFVQAVKEIVSVEKDWVPHAEGTSLYIRPFVIATEPHLGVRTVQNAPVHHHLFAGRRVLFDRYQSGQDLCGG